MATGDDLKLMAIVRRILLEEGSEVTPDDLDIDGSSLGPIGAWIAQPHAALGGSTLMEAYRAGAGEDIIRSAVRSALEAGTAPRHLPLAMSAQAQQLCCLCGAAPASTRDHVPPRGFFKGSTAGLQLITVPACQACNNGASADDEEMRIYLAMEAGKPTAEAAAMWDQGALKSLKRKQALQGQIGRTAAEVKDPATGEERLAFMIPADVVHRVMSRIARGLHFHHLGQPLPASVSAKVDKAENGTDLQAGDLALLNHGAVGGAAFRYAWGVDQDGVSGLWVLQFHAGPTYYVQTGMTAEDRGTIT